ncbi:hypothetical protein SO802_015467 [Lithocarpus litseifolius]|uniref:Uncharacterized protein n=1 Tax=Lithocarpus litseifolius TaxID=425828 RepID=A0AAW2CZ25_9ROSI
MQKTRVELNCWLEKDDAMWLHRSRVNWFQEGDGKTRYFHSKASARFQNNFIEGMEDSSGIWQEDIGIVEGIIVDYYFDLFTSSDPTDFMEFIDAVEPKVSSAMNQMLFKDFQESEVKTTLKQMYPLKAPGSDGRKKRNTFNDIKEKLAKKLARWKEKLFSKAGKEILIKAVA